MEEWYVVDVVPVILTMWTWTTKVKYIEFACTGRYKYELLLFSIVSKSLTLVMRSDLGSYRTESN